MPAALPLHLVECLREVDDAAPAERGRCDREVVALCAQAGMCTVRCPRPPTRAAPDALDAPAQPPEADGALRAELLRYVQRKLFAEDARSQAAGAFRAALAGACLTAAVHAAAAGAAVAEQLLRSRTLLPEQARSFCVCVARHTVP